MFRKQPKLLYAFFLFKIFPEKKSVYIYICFIWVCQKNTMVRTDFILQNVYSTLLNYYGLHFKAVAAISDYEKNIIVMMKRTIDTFRVIYLAEIRQLCIALGRLDDQIFLVTSNLFHRNVSYILVECFKEVFADGVTWSKIITFMLFAAELCFSHGFSGDVIYESFSTLMENKLQSLISSHRNYQDIFSSLKMEEQPTILVRRIWHNTIKMLRVLDFYSGDKEIGSYPRMKRLYFMP